MPTPIVIPLCGATGSKIPLDTEGVAHDGQSQMSYPLGHPNDYQTARLVVGADGTVDDATVAYHLHDYASGENVASVPNAGPNGDKMLTQWDPAEMAGASSMGLRVVVTNPSDTQESHMDVDARVVLLP